MAKQIKAQIDQQMQQQAAQQQEQMQIQKTQQEIDAANAQTKAHDARKNMNWDEQFKSMSAEQKHMFNQLPKEEQAAIKQQIGGAA
jgi:hypothetical protein